MSIEKNHPGPKYYIFSIIIFFLSILVGYIFSQNNPLLIEDIKGTYRSIGILKEFPSYILLLFIFLNNTIKMFFVMFFGFLFGIAPLYFVIVNGFLIGVVSSALLKVAGYKTLLAGILPHGILELGALVIVISYGFWLAVKFWGSLSHKNEFVPYLINSIKFFAKVIVPILAVAALIETFITPYLINLTLR